MHNILFDKGITGAVTAQSSERYAPPTPSTQLVVTPSTQEQIAVH